MGKTKNKENYASAVNSYIKVFCKQHGLLFEYWKWVNYVGGVALVGDYYLDYKDIKRSLDNDIEKDMIFDWHDYSRVQAAQGKEPNSFESYISCQKNKKDLDGGKD